MPPPSLTLRERQVLTQLKQGRTTKEIAHSLHLSPRAVEIYRGSLLAKWQARNSVDLVRRALSFADKEMV
jgi:DNA-binding NarL/FixJ family response regulator